MPEKPTRHLPTRAEIGGEVERLRAKILQTCSEVQETSSKSLEAIAQSREVIAKADAAIAGPLSA